MDFVPKKVICKSMHPEFFPVIGLEMKDKNGVEYHDGHIVKVYYKPEGDDHKYPMLGFIRYFGGRFEIVCPWRTGKEGIERFVFQLLQPQKTKDQKFVMGLNPDHEIVGHIYNDDKLIGDQLKRPFKKEGGIKA